MAPGVSLFLPMFYYGGMGWWDKYHVGFLVSVGLGGADT
jgi:hypothetical protein